MPPMLSQMTRLLFLLMYVYTHTGDGNGNPLQYSCLENPRDGGAWWAAVYGIAQSRTWLKRLSRSSSTHIHTHTTFYLSIHPLTDPWVVSRTLHLCVCVCVCVCAQSLGCVQLFVTPWTIAHQAPLSMGYHNKNTGVGCHFLLQGDLSDPGIEPMSPASPALAGGFFTTEPHGKPFSWILLPQN